METPKLADTALYFNTRDEFIKVKLDRVAYFEADSNYCNVVFINGAHATILTSLTNIEKLLSEKFKTEASIFIRIGKKYIINSRLVFQINVMKQKLVLSDFVAPNVMELNISKEALKNLKSLYTNK